MLTASVKNIHDSIVEPPTKDATAETKADPPAEGPPAEDAAPPPSNTPICDVIMETVTKDGWEFTKEPVKKRTILRASAVGKNGTFRVLIIIKEKTSTVIVYVYSNAKVPEDKRVKAAEYVTRANYGIVLGNFEMDFMDGEFRFKLSTAFPDGEITPKTVELMLAVAAKTMDRYYAGMMSVSYGQIAPADAVKEVEQGDMSKRVVGGEAEF